MRLFLLIMGMVLLCSSTSYGQSIDLQFNPEINCEQLEFCADIQIKVQEEGETANLGSSSILFYYDSLALSYKNYTSLNFDGSDECLLGLFSVWEEHGIDGESMGTFNITLNLGVSLEEDDAIQSCPTIENEWVSISRICFDIIGETNDSLLFFSEEENFISFNNYHPNDGNNQITEGTFIDLITPLSCDLDAPPNAQFTAPTQTGYIPFTAEFDASSSFDNDGNIVSYAWDFGNGDTADGIVTSYTYEEVGIYIVTLTVTDNDGLMGTTQKTIETEPAPLAPQANFEMINTPEGAAPFTIMLSGASSSDEDGVIVSYFWEFGDGETAFGLNAIHTYPMPGEYEVVLTVTDSQGLTDQFIEVIIVTEGEAPPEASINVSTTSGPPPLEVVFDGSESFDPNGELVQYHWFFGDGTEDLNMIESIHTFTEPGSYTVTLIVTDDEGLMAMTTENITVIPEQGNTDDIGMPTAFINVEPFENIAPTSIELSGTASVDSLGEIIAYEWLVNDLLLSNEELFTLDINEAGTYEIVLTVFDDDNQVDHDTLLVFIEEDSGPEPCDNIIQQTENETYLGSICAGDPANLNAVWNLTNEITWTDEQGFVIVNPESYVINNWNCTIEEVQLFSSYVLYDEATCIETTYNGIHMLTVYPEVIATIQALENNCGLELTTCPGYEVVWSDGLNSQEGNIYETEQTNGQVEFTVTNPFAPESCKSKTFQGYYYCTIDLELTLSTTDNPVWEIGQEVPLEISVINKGTIAATNIYIDQMFSQMVSISNQNPSNYYNEILELWTISKLEVQETQVLSFSVTPEEAGDIEINAWVEWADENDIDSYPGNTNLLEDDYASLTVIVSDSLNMVCDQICSEEIACTAPLTPLILCPEYCFVEGNIIIEEYVSIFNCTLTQLENGCFQYMPLPGMEEATIPDELTVIATDDNGNCETIMYEISIGGCNGAPIAVNDYVVTPEDTPINIFVLSNDIDPEDGFLQICDIIVQPAFGTVEIVPEGLRYTPQAGFTGSDVMAYRVCDDSGASNIAFAYVLVHQAGDCETDVIYACVSPGEVVTFCPSFCSFNNTGTFENLTTTEGGLIIDIENTCFRYRPEIDYEGFEEIEATACYEAGSPDNLFCETVRYVVTVNDVCLPNASNLPYLVDDYDTTMVNTTVFIDVLSNDNVPIGQAVELCDVGDPFYGTATITEDGLIAYTPNQDYFGDELFGYTVCDENNNTGYGFVFVHVEEGDPCQLEMETCTAPLKAVEVCLEFCAPNYAIEEYHTTFDCGIQLLSDNCVRYQPLPGFIGTDTIHIEYCNPEGDCMHATVDVIISSDCESERINDNDEFCKISFPNVLTPNDDGVNDLFYVGEWGLCYLDQETAFRVFDRYGNVVYETNQILQENAQLWNGQYLNSDNKVPDGVYYYHLQLANELGLTSRTGFIEVRLK